MFTRVKNLTRKGAKSHRMSLRGSLHCKNLMKVFDWLIWQRSGGEFSGGRRVLERFRNGLDRNRFPAFVPWRTFSAISGDSNFPGERGERGVGEKVNVKT